VLVGVEVIVTVGVTVLVGVTVTVGVGVTVDVGVGDGFGVVISITNVWSVPEKYINTLPCGVPSAGK
jgi:hypothetical protein